MLIVVGKTQERRMTDKIKKNSDIKKNKDMKKENRKYLHFFFNHLDHCTVLRTSF